MGVEVGHQGQQPGHLVLGAGHGRFPRGRRHQSACTVARSRATMSSRSSGGDSTSTSGPRASSSSARRSRRSDHPVPGAVGVGPGHVVLDAGRAPAQRGPGALAHQQGRLDDGGRRGEPPGGRAEVDAVGDVVRRGGTDPAGVADHPREAEDPLLAPVGVQPHDVPAAGVPDDAPRLEVALQGLEVAGSPVVELDRLAGLRRVPEHVEGGLVRAQPRLDQVEGRHVDLHPGRGELAHGVGRRLGEPGVLPHPGGQTDDGGLVSGQPDVGQGEVVGRDAVARLVVEQRVDAADLDRHAERAQLLLVALEHLLEGVRSRVGVQDRPDPLLGDVVALHEQHDQQVEQPFALPAGRCLRVAPHSLGRVHSCQPAGPVSPRRGCRRRSTACRCP